MPSEDRPPLGQRGHGSGGPAGAAINPSPSEGRRSQPRLSFDPQAPGVDCAAVTAPAIGVEALRELRKTRRHNRLADVHWVDALYRVYLAALASSIFLVFASSRLPDDRLSAQEALDFAGWAPGWLGLFFAVGIGIGARSGGRGGPLVLEAPVVVHELQAPVDRAAALRTPAIKQLRFLAFVGIIVGGIVGEVAARRLPVNVAAAIASSAAAFALAAIAGAGLAMIMSGRRVGWFMANAVAGLLIAWSVVDIVAGLTTSPTTLLAQLAMWPIEVQPIALVGVAVAALAMVVGYRTLGGMSVEAALRRAGLVSQLRFAVTLQDVRTVVLLRRQLSQERPRAQPWVRLRRVHWLPAPWKRGLQSVLRFPAVRFVRIVLLGAGAGLAVGTVWRGVTPMIAVAAIALYIAGYDAAEAVAQEVDHPTRWESFPIEPGRLLLQHVPVTFLVMVLVVGIAGAVSLFLVPAQVVVALLPVMILPAAAGAAFAAAVGTAQGAPDTAGLIGLGPDMMGMVLLARLVIPPVLVGLCLLPMLAIGTDTTQLQTSRVANLVTYPLLALVAAFMWLRLRKPKHL